jgi:hypothetical protein
VFFLAEKNLVPLNGRTNSRPDFFDLELSLEIGQMSTLLFYLCDSYQRDMESRLNTERQCHLCFARLKVDR